VPDLLDQVRRSCASLAREARSVTIELDRAAALEPCDVPLDLIERTM
jgi:hypothetical protein